MPYKLPSKKLLQDDYFDNNRFYSLSKMLLDTYDKDKLAVPLGKSKNDNYYLDLEEIPLLLISGESGSGKSMFLDALIVSLLLKNTPDELNFLFFDPKRVELSEYKGIPHLVFDGDYNDSEKIDYINKEIDKRKNKTDLKELIIIADESTYIMQNNEFRNILNTISREGLNLKIHIILATNSYIKKDFNKEILNLFSYIITFDLASKDEEKYLNIKGSSLLKSDGEALVKTKNNSLIKLQMPYISDENIYRVVDFIKKQV